MESCNHNHLQGVLFGTTHSSPICPTIVGDMLGKSLWDNTLFSQLSYHCWRHVRKVSFGQHTLLPVVLPLLETCQENLFGTTHSFFQWSCHCFEASQQSLFGSGVQLDCCVPHIFFNPYQPHFQIEEQPQISSHATRVGSRKHQRNVVFGQ